MKEDEQNPFKNLGSPPQEVPRDLKQKVMDDVNSVKLIMDITSLFSSNYIASIESFFKTKRNTNNRKE